MQQIDFRAMGCQMRAVIDSDDARAADALTRVPGWFEEWENTLSRFRPNSELNQLNKNRALRVSETLWQVLEQSIDAARTSDGLVTPTILASLESAGYDRSFESIDPRATLCAQTHPMPLIDWHTIELDANERTVRLPLGARLDFGGIAKGWAADQAAQRLSAIAPALIDAGGDIAIGGTRANGDRWQISIADPFNPERDLERLVIRVGGIATSGRDYRRWQKNGVPQHHIIDPRTGCPAETDVLSATVIAPTTHQAEVAAKVALILGSRAGLRWLDERPELAGLLVLDDGHVLPSARLDDYVWRDVYVAANNIFAWS